MELKTQPKVQPMHWSSPCDKDLMFNCLDSSSQKEATPQEGLCLAANSPHPKSWPVLLRRRGKGWHTRSKSLIVLGQLSESFQLDVAVRRQNRGLHFGFFFPFFLVFPPLSSRGAFTWHLQRFGAYISHLRGTCLILEFGSFISSSIVSAAFWSLDLSLDQRLQHFGAWISHAHGICLRLISGWFKFRAGLYFF